MAAHQTTTVSAGGGRRAAEMAAVVVAAVLQLVVGWFTSTSGLMAPLWAVALLAAVWVGAIVVLVRLARHRPLLTPLVPLANAVIWFAVMSAGGAWLGWTP